LGCVGEGLGQPLAVSHVGDLLVGGDQPVEHAPDVVIDLDVQTGDGPVNADHPRLEGREGRLQGGGRRLALHEIRLSGTGEHLVMLGLDLGKEVGLVEIARLGIEIDAEPVQHALEVVADLLRRIQHGGVLHHLLEPEVARLMEHGRQVAVLEDADQRLTVLEGDRASLGLFVSANADPIVIEDDVVVGLA